MTHPQVIFRFHFLLKEIMVDPKSETGKKKKKANNPRIQQESYRRPLRSYQKDTLTNLNRLPIDI